MASRLNILRRIGIWFGSFTLSIILFSLALGFGSLRSSFFVFRFTLMFASPVWLLCLPFVFWLKDAEQRRKWIILIGGLLIGPMYAIVFGLIVQSLGRNAHEIWFGDGAIGLGIIQSIPLTIMVGFLTTAFYVVGLKLTTPRISTT